MAHGYTRNLYSAMFNTDKWLDLTPQQRCLWVYLFGGPNTLKAGLLPKSYAEMQRQSGLDRVSVNEALDLFASEAYGWILHDQKYILIKDFIEDQSNSTLWTAGAIKEAKALQDKTELASYILERYGNGTVSDAVRTPSERRSNAVKTPSKRQSNGARRRTNSDTASVSESDTGTEKYTREAAASPALFPGESGRARKLTIKELTAQMKASSPSLADLEAKVPAAWRPLWDQWKVAQGQARKGQEIAESVLIAELIEFTAQQQSKSLSDAAMVQGLVQTLKRHGEGRLDKLSTGYAIAIATRIDSENNEASSPPPATEPPRRFDISTQKRVYAED